MAYTPSFVERPLHASPRHRLERSHRVGSGRYFEPGRGRHRRRQQHAGRFLRPAGRHPLEPAAAGKTAALHAPRTRHSRPRRRAALLEELRPDAIVHAAAQPSHDLAASRPFDDFDVNAVGTLNMLEARAGIVPERRLRLHVAPTRSTATRPTNCRSRSSRPAGSTPGRGLRGIREDFRIDRSQAFDFRRVEGRGRRDGAGVRPLLRHEDMLSSAAAASPAPATRASSCTASSATW